MKEFILYLKIVLGVTIATAWVGFGAWLLGNAPTLRELAGFVVMMSGLLIFSSFVAFRIAGDPFE